MTPQRSHTKPAERAVPALLGLAALLVVGAAAAARRHLALPAVRPLVGLDVGAILGLVGVGIVLLIVFAVLAGVTALWRRRRRSEEEPQAVAETPHSWWAQLVAAVGALVVLALPIAVLVTVAHHRGARTQQPQPPAVIAPVVGEGSSRPTPPLSAGTITAIVLLAFAVLVAAAAVIALLARQRRHRRQRANVTVSLASPVADEPSDAALHRAVSRGRAAIGDITDPRAAIIACYQGMQQALAAEGVATQATDTPTELLARVTSSPATADAARRLTWLFLEARFSDHPMTPAQLAAALDALHALSPARASQLRAAKLLTAPQ